MKISSWILLGAALTVTPLWAQMMGHAAPDSAPTQAATIPPDQQATKEQLARLFEVMRLRQQLDTTMKAIPEMIQQQIHTQMSAEYAKLPEGSQPSAEQQAKLEALMKKYMDRAATLYPPEQMMADMTSIYQRHMSKTDVEAYIAFYNTPAGQHLLDAQPVIMQEYLPLVMQHVQAGGKELTDEMSADVKDLMKSTPATGATPAQK